MTFSVCTYQYILQSTPDVTGQSQSGLCFGVTTTVIYQMLDHSIYFRVDSLICVVRRSTLSLQFPSIEQSSTTEIPIPIILF